MLRKYTIVTKHNSHNILFLIIIIWELLIILLQMFSSRKAHDSELFIMFMILFFNDFAFSMWVCSQRDSDNTLWEISTWFLLAKPRETIAKLVQNHFQHRTLNTVTLTGKPRPIRRVSVKLMSVIFCTDLSCNWLKLAAVNNNNYNLFMVVINNWFNGRHHSRHLINYETSQILECREFSAVLKMMIIMRDANLCEPVSMRP